MGLINRDTDYAVRALCFIARYKNKIISVAELVNILKVPGPFLRKILQKLNRNNLLKSYKGQGGGFKLAASPDKIFLADLINIFQGSFRLNECLFKGKPCPNKALCILKTKIDAIEEEVVEKLKSINVKSLM